MLMRFDLVKSRDEPEGCLIRVDDIKRAAEGKLKVAGYDDKQDVVNLILEDGPSLFVLDPGRAILKKLEALWEQPKRE